MPLKFNVNKLAVVGYLTMVHLYAALGIVFVVVFVAIQLKLTNVKGSVDPISERYQAQAENVQVLAAVDELNPQATDSASVDTLNRQITLLQDKRAQRIQVLCGLKHMGDVAGNNLQKILNVDKVWYDEELLQNMIFVVKNHSGDQEDFVRGVTQCVDAFDSAPFEWGDLKQTTNDVNLLLWTQAPQWQTVKAAIEKDREVIHKAAATTGIRPRLLVSNLVVEQMRLYYSQRELYQKYFEPLKIFANANKTSLGVMSIKEETARAIEAHLVDRQSAYYLGEPYESLLAFPSGIDISAERFVRLTSEDHYYNYLYGAVYLKQFLTQWSKAGYPIEARPEIVATLFNVGFAQSKPNSNPQVGGSLLTVEEEKYSFGRFAHEFYYSTELINEFPL